MHFSGNFRKVERWRDGQPMQDMVERTVQSGRCSKEHVDSNLPGFLPTPSPAWTKQPAHPTLNRHTEPRVRYRGGLSGHYNFGFARPMVTNIDHDNPSRIVEGRKCLPSDRGSASSAVADREDQTRIYLTEGPCSERFSLGWEKLSPSRFLQKDSVLKT